MTIFDRLGRLERRLEAQEGQGAPDLAALRVKVLGLMEEFSSGDKKPAPVGELSPLDKAILERLENRGRQHEFTTSDESRRQPT